MPAVCSIKLAQSYITRKKINKETFPPTALKGPHWMSSFRRWCPHSPSWFRVCHCSTSHQYWGMDSLGGSGQRASKESTMEEEGKGVGLGSFWSLKCSLNTHKGSWDHLACLLRFTGSILGPDGNPGAANPKRSDRKQEVVMWADL